VLAVKRAGSLDSFKLTTAFAWGMLQSIGRSLVSDGYRVGGAMSRAVCDPRLFSMAGEGAEAASYQGRVL